MYSAVTVYVWAYISKNGHCSERAWSVKPTMFIAVVIKYVSFWESSLVRVCAA